MLVTFSNFLSERKFKKFIIRTSNNLSHSIFFFNKLLSHDLKIDLIVLINFKCFLFSLWLQVLLKWYFNSLWFFLAITLKIETWKRIWIKIHSPFRLNFMFLSLSNLNWLLIYLSLFLIRIVLIVWNTSRRLHFTIWMIDWIHLHWFLIRNFFRIRNLISLKLKLNMICIFLTIFIQIWIYHSLSIMRIFGLLIILYLTLTIRKLNWLLIILVQAWRIFFIKSIILLLIILLLILDIWGILNLILSQLILVLIWNIWGILIIILLLIILILLKTLLKKWIWVLILKILKSWIVLIYRNILVLLLAVWIILFNLWLKAVINRLTNIRITVFYSNYLSRKYIFWLDILTISIILLIFHVYILLL